MTTPVKSLTSGTDQTLAIAVQAEKFFLGRTTGIATEVRRRIVERLRKSQIFGKVNAPVGESDYLLNVTLRRTYYRPPFAIGVTLGTLFLVPVHEAETLDALIELRDRTGRTVHETEYLQESHAIGGLLMLPALPTCFFVGYLGEPELLYDEIVGVLEDLFRTPSKRAGSS